MSPRLIEQEPLLQGRNSLLPIQYPEAWRMAKQLRSSTWPFEEIKLQDDIAQVNNRQIKPEIMRVVEFVLGFFSGADQIVNVNLAVNMLTTIKIPEAQCFYNWQIGNETDHVETYSRLVEALVRYPDDPEYETRRRTEVLNAVDHMACVKKLYAWAQRWIHKTTEQEQADNPILQMYEQDGTPEDVLEDLAVIWDLGKRLVAFACVEGIMFSAAFAIIFWIKEQKILPGFTFSNELISRDEGLHRDFACLMYLMIVQKPPQSQVLAIIREVVEEFMDEFIDEMLAKPLTGMSAIAMKQYVRFVADNLTNALGYPSIYKVANPFAFMDKISYNGITNFFEKRVGEYALSGFEQGATEQLALTEDY
jgi:ribonucleotide reductase beta subunit family protein with ferritin-like domain